MLGVGDAQQKAPIESGCQAIADQILTLTMRLGSQRLKQAQLRMAEMLTTARIEMLTTARIVEKRLAPPQTCLKSKMFPVDSWH